ncbi:MAG TPA: hypothetical protein PLG34_13975, partial [Spirochaetota bacterium]|nr:hypothetical protein [Spirochaetota bacterium]
MNLNQWYYYLLGGDYSLTRYSVYLAYRIINSQEDRIANNRSLVELRFFAVRRSSSYYVYNGYDNTSYYEYDGGNRFNTTTRYDFRNATVNVGYFIDDGNSVLYKGSKHTFYVYHKADGRRNLP